MSAVVFKGCRIISSAHSCFRVNGVPPKYKKYTHTLHAEQSVIMNGNKDKMKGASILVLRTNLSGNLSLAYPCPYCLESIKLVGIRWVYFSDRTEKLKIIIISHQKNWKK